MHYVQAETFSTDGTEETGGFLCAVGSACTKMHELSAARVWTWSRAAC